MAVAFLVGLVAIPATLVLPEFGHSIARASYWTYWFATWLLLLPVRVVAAASREAETSSGPADAIDLLFTILVLPGVAVGAIATWSGRWDDLQVLIQDALTLEIVGALAVWSARPMSAHWKPASLVASLAVAGVAWLGSVADILGQGIGITMPWPHFRVLVASWMWQVSTYLPDVAPLIVAFVGLGLFVQRWNWHRTSPARSRLVPTESPGSFVWNIALVSVLPLAWQIARTASWHADPFSACDAMDRAYQVSPHVPDELRPLLGLDSGREHPTALFPMYRTRLDGPVWAFTVSGPTQASTGLVVAVPDAALDHECETRLDLTAPSWFTTPERPLDPPLESWIHPSLGRSQRWRVEVDRTDVRPLGDLTFAGRCEVVHNRAAGPWGDVHVACDEGRDEPVIHRRLVHLHSGIVVAPSEPAWVDAFAEHLDGRLRPEETFQEFEVRAPW